MENHGVEDYELMGELTQLAIEIMARADMIAKNGSKSLMQNFDTSICVI